MAIRISVEARNAAVATIDDEHTLFEAAAALPDLTLANAPLAASATELFRTEWDRAVTQYQDLLDAVATVLGVVADALIEVDRQAAEATTVDAPRVSGPR